ncbi:hypothetical protein [Rugamonas rivuli]|uniref:Aspartyl protease n=1 Tax=Rugamonas rivuli TaxID=2743358 RepID=A0A843S7S4_9BURK|nr:hypothetical protein [Rugamonas rivuli]MQA18224.1 hypothetical protein [Rugamonas rivuli]
MMKYFLIFLITHIATVLSKEWTPTQWIWKKQSDGTFSRLSMLLPVSLVGSNETYYFNFDTGAEVSLLFKNNVFLDRQLSEIINHSPRVYLSKEYHEATNYGVVLEGKILDASISKLPFLFHNLVTGQKSHVIGSVGLNAFSAAVLAIDFIANRAMQAENVDIIGSSSPVNIHYQDYTLSSGLPLVSLSTMGKKQGIFVLDTGFSIAELAIFNLDTWKAVTGRSLDDFRNKKIIEHTLGRRLVCIIAPSLLDIDFGPVRLGKLTTAYCLRDGIPFKETGLDGLLGNPVFYDKAILVFDTKNRQLGIGIATEPKK